ncbi:MAG: hypothetical protein RLZZ519_2912 [Bacteroidota bacterium]|jgi:hypothetical protein
MTISAKTEKTADADETLRSLKEAQGVGGRVFMTFSYLQALIVFFVFLGFVIDKVHGDAMSEYGRDYTFPEFLQNAVIRSILLAAAVSGVLLMFLSWRMGRRAGKFIGIAKRNFVWVGPVAAFWPSAFAAFAFVMTAALLDRRFERDVNRNFPLVMSMVTLFYFVPGILTGFFAGFVTRKRLRVRQKAAAIAREWIVESD